MPTDTVKITYDIPQIRYLLVDAFSDAEFQELCFDCFRTIYNRFTTGMDLSLKILALVEHCERQGLLDKLVKIVKERNPYQYENYKDKLFIGEFDEANANPIGTTYINFKIIGAVDLANVEHRAAVEASVAETLSAFQNPSLEGKKVEVSLIEVTQVQKYSTEN